MDTKNSVVGDINFLSKFFELFWIRPCDLCSRLPPTLLVTSPLSVKSQVTSQDVPPPPLCTAMAAAKYLGLCDQISRCMRVNTYSHPSVQFSFCKCGTCSSWVSYHLYRWNLLSFPTSMLLPRLNRQNMQTLHWHKWKTLSRRQVNSWRFGRNISAKLQLEFFCHRLFYQTFEGVFLPDASAGSFELSSALSCVEGVAAGTVGEAVSTSDKTEVTRALSDGWMLSVIPANICARRVREIKTLKLSVQTTDVKIVITPRMMENFTLHQHQSNHNKLGTFVGTRALNLRGKLPKNSSRDPLHGCPWCEETQSEAEKVTGHAGPETPETYWPGGPNLPLKQIMKCSYQD